MSVTRIAHLTDSHTTSLEGVTPRELLSKRLLGYISWRRKRRFRHTQAMLEAATQSALRHEPDALVLTGDLLHIGLAQEMREIRPWLTSLIDRLPVLLVPGNHDLYTADSYQHWQSELGDLPIFGDPVSRDSEWPRQLVVNDVRIIGLSSAYPAPLRRADGRLGESQRQCLSNTLGNARDQASDAPQNTLLALHHPAETTLCAERKSLLDAAELKRIINDNSVTGLVHGHLHENLSYQVGTTPCYCTASASSTHAPALASYRLLEFTGSNLMTNRLFQADGPTSPQFAERKAS